MALSCMADIPATKLIEFATDFWLERACRGDAGIVATSLVGANLRGHDSHGVMRVLQYVEFVERGEIRIGVDLRVVQETPAMLVCDGQWGLGQVQVASAAGSAFSQGEGARRGGWGGARLRAHRPTGRICRTSRVGRTDADGDRQQLRRLAAGRPTWRNRAKTEHEPVLCLDSDRRTRDAPIVADFGTSVVAEGKVRGHYISQRRRSRRVAAGSQRPADDGPGGALRTAAGHDSAARGRPIVQGLRPGVDSGALGRGPFRRAVQRSRGTSGRREQHLSSWFSTQNISQARSTSRAGQPVG